MQLQTGSDKKKCACKTNTNYFEEKDNNMKTSIKVPFVLLFLMVSLPVHAALFTFNKDSTFTPIPDTIIMQNTTNSLIIIDSVLVLFDTAQMPTCEIDFRVEPQSSIRSSWFQYWYGPASHYFTLALNQNESIKLMNFQFDLCIACPTMQSGMAKVPIGDTIRAGLVFYSGIFKDTLKIKSIRRILSMGLVSRSAINLTNNPNISGNNFNLAGRVIRSNRLSGYRAQRNNIDLQLRK
jgi:hypothetical protein